MPLVSPNTSARFWVSPGFDLRQESYTPLADLPLDPAMYATFQGAGPTWAFALNAGKLRATYVYDPVAVKVWAGATMTGAALIYNWPMPFSNTLLNAISTVLYSATIPTANGLGCGLGFVNHPTTPTKYATRIHVRDGATTDTVRDTSDLQNNAVVALTAHRNGIAERRTGPTRATYYGLNEPNISTELNPIHRASTFQKWTGETVYPALFFEGGLNDGTIDVDRVQAILNQMGS